MAPAPHTHSQLEYLCLIVGICAGCACYSALVCTLNRRRRFAAMFIATVCAELY